jgi:hypothetical protein
MSSCKSVGMKGVCSASPNGPPETLSVLLMSCLPNPGTKGLFWFLFILCRAHQVLTA